MHVTQVGEYWEIDTGFLVLSTSCIVSATVHDLPLVTSQPSQLHQADLRMG